jgi:type IV pilus assembly protein PilC
MPKKLQRKLPVPKASGVVAPAADGKGGKIRGRVGPHALAEFTSQLAVLLNAGIPIMRSLRVIEGQLTPGPMKRICQQLVEDVEGGTPLSEAMQKHASTFDALYTNMVRAGEAGGVQEEILNRLAGFLEKSQVIKQRVIGALMYPIAITVVATAVLLLVFALVIPKFRALFEQMGGGVKFHWSTQVVMALGDYAKTWWWTWLLAVVIVILVHRVLMLRVTGYRRFMHRVALRMPVFGRLLHMSLVGRFARTFGTLIQSGVPHLDALDILRASVGNVHMRDAVASVHSSIREGAGIAVPMGESGMFDDIVVNMVDVGEQTGELDRMLTKIADRYEAEVDRKVDTTFKVIETLVLVLMAIGVGFIVFALFRPLIDMMRSLNRH